MSSGTRTLIALAAGLAVGAAIRAAQAPVLTDVAKALTPLGGLWLAALKMTLVPLIFTLVATGVSAWTTTGQGRRMIGGAICLFAGLLAFAAVAGAAIMSALLQLWPTPPGALAFLAQGAQAGQAVRPAAPTVTDQLMGLIPTNLVAAAANDAMTPLVIFAVLFGLALTRIDPGRRAVVRTMLQGVGEAMMVIVEWVLNLAPIGIFILALGVALNTGLQAAGVLAQATVLTAIPPIVGIGVCYLVAWLGGGIGVAHFARAIMTPQAVAVGTTSSMATLPAMIEAAETELDCPAALAGAILPLAVSTFRFGNVLMITGTVVFAAAAAGLHPSLAQIAVAGFVVVLTNLGIVGLPAAAVLYAAEAPAFPALGVPLAVLPLIIAIAAIPDIADTVCNVTADLAVTAVVRRWTLTSAAWRLSEAAG